MKLLEEINMSRRRFLQLTGLGTVALAVPLVRVATAGPPSAAGRSTGEPVPQVVEEDEGKWAGAGDLPVTCMAPAAVAPVMVIGFA